MLAAAFVLGVPTMDSAHKQQMRELAINRWEFSGAERTDLMRYCAEDVQITEQIQLRMAPALDWPQALIRGRYGIAGARMEHNGVPINVPMWNCLRERWPDICGQLLDSVNASYGVFIDGHFSDQRFLDYLSRQGIAFVANDPDRAPSA